MGNNTVAVLLNDFTAEIEASGAVGKRIAHAMKTWSPATRDGYFGAGTVISRDHSSGHQIVVVHGNTGCIIDDAKDLPYWQLEKLAECLNRHGWLVKPPPRKQKAPK